MKVRETAATIDGAAIDEAIDWGQRQSQSPSPGRKKEESTFLFHLQYISLEESRHKQQSSNNFICVLNLYCNLNQLTAATLELETGEQTSRRTHVVCAIFASCPKVASDKMSDPPHHATASHCTQRSRTPSNSSARQQVPLDSTWLRCSLTSPQFPPSSCIFSFLLLLLLSCWPPRNGFDPTFQLRGSS